MILLKQSIAVFILRLVKCDATLVLFVHNYTYNYTIQLALKTTTLSQYELLSSIHIVCIVVPGKYFITVFKIGLKTCECNKGYCLSERPDEIAKRNGQNSSLPLYVKFLNRDGITRQDGMISSLLFESAAKGTKTLNQRCSSVETRHFMVYINIYDIYDLHIRHV